jgi:hypothetical protein
VAGSPLGAILLSFAAAHTAAATAPGARSAPSSDAEEPPGPVLFVPTGQPAPAEASPGNESLVGRDPRERFDPTKHEFLFVVIPMVSLNSDDGIGGGAVFALHHHFGGIEPLRDDLSLRLFITDRLVQRHELRWEGMQVLDLPLRMWARVGFFSTLTQPFCGYGSGVTCNKGVAERAALEAGLTPGTDAFDDFARRFYMMRYLRPHADTVLRWRLRDKPHRVELLTGYRFAWYFSGSLLEGGPWPGSLYEKIFPEGEPGIASVPQVGVTIDDRDFEPAPSRGYFVEASVRGGHPLWGSSWTWAGMNLSLHGYDQLLASPHTVYAGRLLIDLADGTMPTEEMAQIGGTRDHAAFGGQWIGRGVRDRRYNGKLKVIHQSEVRTDLLDFELWNVRFDVASAVFADLGWIGFDKDNLGGAFPLIDGVEPWRAGHPFGLVWGAGVGVRVLVNRAIVGRFEVAGSPLEERSPSFYTPVGNSL